MNQAKVAILYMPVSIMSQILHAGTACWRWRFDNNLSGSNNTRVVNSNQPRGRLCAYNERYMGGHVDLNCQFGLTQMLAS